MVRTQLLRLILMTCLASWSWAANFGKVVQIGGHASDLALDERRGLLYVANFTANRIEVISTSDYARQSPYRVPPQPGSIALSPDGRYLVIAHYARWTDPVGIEPAVTILDLDTAGQRTLSMTTSPLAVAFGGGNQALVVSETGFQLLDPVTGAFQDLRPSAMAGKDLPVPFATFPPQIIQASVGVSGDRQFVMGLATTADQDEGVTVDFKYNVYTQELLIGEITAEPPLGPRVVSVDRDGRNALLGWALFNDRGVLMAQFPYGRGELNIGSHAFDWSRPLIYAQVPEGTTDATKGGAPPVLHILDSDNLTVRERIRLAENLAGRSVLSSDSNTMYALSDSGVTVLPVGSLGQAHRVVASGEDMLFRGSFCDQRIMTQDIDITDPAGGSVDFKLSTTLAGVTISPAAGTTPARVRVSVDQNVYQNSKGTWTGFIDITSQAAVNLSPSIRVLINTREPEQRGVLFNVGGKLVDILPDPVRDRFYVIRQDKNLVLVFNGTTFQQITTLRTGNTPTQMAMTRDNRYLLVGNDNSQIVNVYDLELLQQLDPIVIRFGHYPRSIAVSNNTILTAVRGVSKPEGSVGVNTIDQISLDTRSAVTPPTLGIYTNDIPIGTVLTTSRWGSKILAAMPDGTVLLYDDDAGTFVASRKDFAALGGAIAGLTEQLFVADNNMLNSSLTPVAALDTTSGATSGFTIHDGLGARTLAPSASTPGVVQRVDLDNLQLISSTKMIEAPLLAGSLATAPVGQIGQTILPFLRTLVMLSNRNTYVSLSVSGFTVLPWDYDAALAKPVIQSVVNLADGRTAVAPGGLASILGSNLSRLTLSNSELPVPTILGDVCLTVNAVKAPLLMVSPGQVNMQMPFEVVGSASLVLRTPGGMSEPFQVNVLATAPAVFHTGTAGPDTGLAAIYRAVNGEPVTLSNPVHPGDYLVFYVTGLGLTTPAVADGAAAPFDPLAIANVEPLITLGGVALPVSYAGLVPGQVGVYQINVFVPEQVPRGMQVPLVLGGPEGEMSFPVRVVN